MDSSRFEYARWVLERNLHWVSLVEAKTAVVASVDTAMLGALAVAFGALEPSERTAWGILWLVFASVLLCLSIARGALAVWPQTNGPPTSFVFFGKIKAVAADVYRREFLAADDDALLNDLLAQIHRNAEIASNKYTHVTTSMKLAIVSLPIWVIALTKLVLDNH